MLDWKFSQVCHEYFDVLYGMCYAVTHNDEEAQREALNCMMDVADHMKMRHTYEDTITLAILAGTNFLFRKWEHNHLDAECPPVIKVDKNDFLY